MTVTERVDRFQRRHPGVGFPLVVLYKLGDDDGHFPAALLLRGNRQLKQQVPASALGGLPVIGPQLGSPDRLGGVQGMVIGTIVALYGGTGLGQALDPRRRRRTAAPAPRRASRQRSRSRRDAVASPARVTFHERRPGPGWRSCARTRPLACKNSAERQAAVLVRETVSTPPQEAVSD